MFEITIKKIGTEKRTERGPWVALSKRLITEEDITPSAYNYSGNNKLRERIHSGEPIFVDKMGHAPDVEETREFQYEVYSQRVDEMNLPAVIKAINNIP